MTLSLYLNRWVQLIIDLTLYLRIIKRAAKAQELIALVMVIFDLFEREVEKVLDSQHEWLIH